MPKFATKAADNMFCQARYEAAKFNERLSSREGAAEELGVDRTRLARIELGSVTPYPEEVLLMADIYRAPELKGNYCREMCPLGKGMPKIESHQDIDNEINANCVYEEGWQMIHATVFYDQLKKLADYILEHNLDMENDYYISLFEENFFHPKQPDDLEKAYVYVLSLHKTRKHRDGATESKRLVYFCIMYMDDILLIGAREADVKRAARALEKYLLKEYGLTIKPDADLFPIDYRIKTGNKYENYREKDKAERRGKPIDMMGYVIYRDHTEIRSKIFLRARRAYSVAWYCMKNRVEIPLEIAYKCTSYYGWFKHTDSKYVKDKYNIDAVCAAAKRRISKHAKSEIYGTSARSALAAC